MAAKASRSGMAVIVQFDSYDQSLAFEGRDYEEVLELVHEMLAGPNNTLVFHDSTGAVLIRLQRVRWVRIMREETPDLPLARVVHLAP